MDIQAEIGFTAGEIYFSGIDKPVEIEKVQKKINKGEHIFYLAVGWLAREGKIEIYAEKNKTYIRKIN